MKVLLIGSGGREHAMAWKLAQSPTVEKVYVAPGNGGTALEKKCSNVDLPGSDPCTVEGQKLLIEFAQREKIDLAVIGPEAPLAAGIADCFRKASIKTVGTGIEAARLESSKAFSKDFMQKYGVRTAASTTWTDYNKALAAVQEHFSASQENGGPGPLVVKADGLAAGKGVVVAETREQAEDALKAFMQEGKLGAAGSRIVLEQFLEGVEVSVLAAVSVSSDKSKARQAALIPFISARDHKRRYENAQGPNTGGMGAIAPVPDFDQAAQDDFKTNILEATLRGMLAEGFDYRGFIFFGLMVHNGRCSLLEYNVRLGDPETQAVLPLMDSDFAELCLAIEDGSLGSFPVTWKKGAVCAPVAVADGYPGAYRKGDPISVDTDSLLSSGATLFHAGTLLDADALACNMGAGATEAGVLRTAGGRVLAVSALGQDADSARKKAYAGLAAIHFDGLSFRQDIGIEGSFQHE